MNRSARRWSLHVLSDGFAALPFAFAAIRAAATGGKDLRYVWVALAALAGAAIVVAVAGRHGKSLGAVGVLFAAILVSSTLLAIVAALLLGTVLGVGILVVAFSFGLCFAAGGLLHVLALDSRR